MSTDESVLNSDTASPDSRHRTVSIASYSSQSSYCIVDTVAAADGSSNSSTADDLNPHTLQGVTNPTSVASTGSCLSSRDRDMSRLSRGFSEDVSTNNCSPMSESSSSCPLLPAGDGQHCGSVCNNAPLLSCPATVCLGAGGVGWRLGDDGSLSFRPGVSCFIPQGANTRWWSVSTIPRHNFVLRVL